MNPKGPIHSLLQHVTEVLLGAACLPGLQVRFELGQIGYEPLELLAGKAHFGHHETHSCVRAAFQVLLERGDNNNNNNNNSGYFYSAVFD